MLALIILIVVGIIVLYGEFIKNKSFLVPIAITGLLLVAILFISIWNKNLTYFTNAITFDNYSIAFIIVIITSTIFIFLLANQYFKGVEKHVAEIYSLLIFTVFGTILMVSYNNLAVLFIGIETMSIPLYILAGSKKFSLRSNEASFKYFILSSVASAFFLLGVVFIYGATATFNTSEIFIFTKEHLTDLPGIFKLGVFFILIAFCFKMAVVPFHFWVPDVYEGSPTLITAFMASVVKTATFAAFLRLILTGFVLITKEWLFLLAALTVITLIIANLGALQQLNIKRMLSYSSIAHSGYILLGILALTNSSSHIILYYVIAYSIATIPAFGILIVLKNFKGANANLEAFNGLSKRNPVFALIMSISLFSLSGIPITAGFFAKYYLFINAISQHYFWLVIIAIITSLIGVYFYFKIIVAMYFKPADTGLITCDVPYLISLSLCSLATLFIGLFPSLILSLNLFPF